MTCEELTEFLSQYLEDELPAGQRAVFEEHLQLCPPCEVYLDSFKDTIKLGKEVSCPQEQEKMPENLVRAILAARESAKKDGGE